MTTEYGIFSDEGHLEGDLYSREAAEARLAAEYAEDDARVAVCCEQHREQEAGECSECAEEENIGRCKHCYELTAVDPDSELCQECA